MSKRFPRASVEVWYAFTATHSIARSKKADARIPHDHDYEIGIGFHHERNGPYTWDRYELHEKYSPLIDALNGQDLNEVIGEDASDETLASWCVAKLPGWVDYVIIQRETPDEASLRAVTKVRKRDLE